MSSHRRVTPRVRHIHKLDDVLHKEFSTNLSPTLRAVYLGHDDDKGYFVISENKEWTKYNECAGEVFWIPLSIVVCMEPLQPVAE